MQVLVRDNNVDQALKALKKKMQREGIFREMKLRGHYEKPSEKKATREGGSHPPRPQAGAQEAAARRSVADEAEAGHRGRRQGRPAARPPVRLKARSVRSGAGALSARAFIFGRRAQGG